MFFAIVIIDIYYYISLKFANYLKIFKQCWLFSYSNVFTDFNPLMPGSNKKFRYT